MVALALALLPLALRDENDSGYRLITGRDIGAAHQAISENTGMWYIELGALITVLALILYFLGAWGLAILRETRLPRPPEIPPGPPPTVPRVDVEEETKPTGSGGVRDSSRWRGL